MLKVTIILWVLTSIFISCKNTPPLPIGLTRAQNLCAPSPEKAIRHLRGLANDTVNWTIYQRNIYKLLIVKAEDKTSIISKDTNLLKGLVSFFDTHGDDSKRVSALYHLGRSYEEMQDIPKAMENYITAVSIAENSCSPIDDRDWANIYFRLSNIYRLFKNSEIALSYTVKALHLLEKAGESETKDYALLATCYYEKGCIDSTRKYNDIVYSHILQEKSIVENADIIASQLAFYSEYGEFHATKERLKSIFQIPKDKRSGQLLCSLSSYYDKHNFSDSAIAYARLALIQPHTPIYVRQNAIAILNRNYSQNGRFSQAQYYAEWYIKLTDSIYNQQAKNEITLSKKVLQYYQNKNRSLNLLQSNAAKDNWIISLVSLLTGGVAVFGYSHWRTKEDHRNEMKEERKQNEKEKNKLKEQLHITTKMNEIAELNESSIIQFFNEKGKRGVTVTNDRKWQELQAVLERQTPYLLSEWTNSYGILLKDEIRILCLKRIGFTHSCIENVMGISHSSLWRKLSRLQLTRNK